MDLNNTLLKESYVKAKKKSRRILKFFLNGIKMIIPAYQNLWDTMKIVPRGKFIVLYLHSSFGEEGASVKKNAFRCSCS